MNINSEFLIDEYGVKSPKDLPLILRSLRHQKGYSQKQIAEMLGISQKTMSALERNASSANFSRIVKLLELLDAEIIIKSKN
ncbi:MAG: helix-turn-helix transcriptional regulator [Burkholderiales bacterium]|jgi:HTH-type transcriptional regulator / antitoxin HipB|uniref:helix-turn-helix domain-containing protein n=1 Tax=Limnobacter sp. TaxID=2003368 RepID=UPI0039BCF554|nr:helix-turn-helix transcriptional regulator [Burkholderiales bacterium]